MTTCSGLTRVAGQSRCLYKLPWDCEPLSSTSLDWWQASQAVEFCPRAFDWDVSTMVTTCFPEWFDEDDNARTLYDCLNAAAVCSSTTACATNTYTVGQEPTITGPTIPAATVPVLQNPGFESGTMDGWTINDEYGLPFNAMDVSSARVHSGSMAVRAVFLNDKGRASHYSQDVQGTPGGNYTFSMWASHDKPAGSNCRVALWVHPVLAWGQNNLNLRGVPAGGWHRVSIDFQAAASWTTLGFIFACDRVGDIGSEGGKDTLYMDDLALVSRDL